MFVRYGSTGNYPVLANIPDYAQTAVASRMFYIKHANLFYARIPKCANSTVSKTLAAHAGITDLDAGGMMVKIGFNMFPTPQEFELANKVTIIREPTARVISGWKDKGCSANWIKKYKFAGNATDTPTLLQFLHQLKETNFYRNAHFIPQVHMIPGNTADYHIGTVENLPNDLIEICEDIFGSYQGLSEKNVGRTNAQSLVSELSVEERGLINQIFEEDLDFYHGVLRNSA